MSVTLDDILNQPVNGFLDRLAERSPTPGGGSVAALAGSLGCAMARMVLAYTKGASPAVTKATERLARADQLLRRLVTEDMAAYQTLSDANKAMKNNPADSAARQGALITATMVPAEMAAVATEALAAMDESKEQAGKYLVSDLGVAACLARACVESARFSVRVNLPEIDDAEVAGEFSAQLAELSTRADALSAGICDWVNARLQPS